MEVFFDNSSYTISMEDGSGPSINGTVEACVLLDGSIERPAPFNIYTTAGSANAGQITTYNMFVLLCMAYCTLNICALAITFFNNGLFSLQILTS